MLQKSLTLLFVALGFQAAAMAQSDSIILARSQQIDSDFHITLDHQGILDSLEALGVLEGREIAAGITNIFQLYDSLQTATISANGPTASISITDLTSGGSAYDTTLAVTFTLSEASTDFTADDVTTDNGCISDFAGSGTSYTATFKPITEGTCTIDVAAGGFTNAKTYPNKAADQFSWIKTKHWWDDGGLNGGDDWRYVSTATYNLVLDSIANDTYTGPPVVNLQVADTDEPCLNTSGPYQINWAPAVYNGKQLFEYDIADEDGIMAIGNSIVGTWLYFHFAPDSTVFNFSGITSGTGVDVIKATLHALTTPDNPSSGVGCYSDWDDIVSRVTSWADGTSDPDPCAASTGDTTTGDTTTGDTTDSGTTGGTTGGDPGGTTGGDPGGTTGDPCSPPVPGCPGFSGCSNPAYTDPFSCIGAGYTWI